MTATSRPATAPRPMFMRRNHSAASVPQTHGSKSTAWIFGGVIALLAVRYQWPWRYMLSGAPLLTLVLLVGRAYGHRALVFLPLWTLLVTVHLGYAVASTSWLLHSVFVVLCYPTITLCVLVQSSVFADLVRRYLRRVLTQVQFVNDTVAYFDLPALEIDKDVFGLMVVRGITISFSRLTIVAHGIEVGIMLSDDIELALQTEEVTVALFRRITISTVYANLKGGLYEMTFGNLDTRAQTSPDAKTADGVPLMVSDSALLQRASTTGDLSRPPIVKMTSRMTHAAPPTDIGSKSALRSVTRQSPDSAHAARNYEDTIKWIESTNLIHQCQKSAIKMRDERTDLDDAANSEAEFDIRAAVSTMLHSHASVPHPPPASVKVTTLRNLSSPRTKRLLHRMPLLLRALLSPISYLHPIHIGGIVAAGSGLWITAQLQDKIFQKYAEDNAELRRLEKRILTWLSDANFILTLDDVTAQANVPFSSLYDILCSINIASMKAHRTVQKDDVRPTCVVRMGGADAHFSIPSFLLPHHEHIVPGPSDPDETAVQMSVHGRLPASFDQELLNFIASLVKATKVVELERSAEHEAKTESDGEPSRMFRDLAQSLNKGMKDGMKKIVAEGIVQERWIAKMVGRITQHLQTAQGEVGYSGAIPVPLAPYRLPKDHPEAVKILE